MADHYSKIVADRILSLCKQRGMSIYQLSIMSGVSYSTVENVVKNKSFNPKLKTLHKIATAFSMTPAELLNFEELNNYSFDEAKDD